MFNFVTEEVKTDSTPEFRKCWALGEAFYYVKSYFEGESNKGYLYTKTKLETIDNISKNLELQNEKIYVIIEELRNKLPEDQPRKTDKDEKSIKSLTELETYLKASLTGLEPQFEYIFSTAEDCLLLYFEGEKTKDFLENLIKFKNFTSPDKVELIVNVVNYWDKHDYKGTKLHDHKWRNFPREVKNRIAGLILGTNEISDILTKWDRVYWVLICFIIVGLLIILAAIFLISVLFNIYQGFIAKAPLVNETVNGTAANANATASTSEGDLMGILTMVSTLAASIIPALGSAIIIWQKFAKFVERRLAQDTLTRGLNKRIKNKG